MNKKLFLIFSIFLYSSLIISCTNDTATVDAYANTTQQKSPIETDDYSERVNNITAYLNAANIELKNECTQIFILQSNKCGACSEDDYAALKEQFTNLKNKPSIFILTEKNVNFLSFIKQNFDAVATNVYYDTDKKLSKYGLFFLKNLYINYCNKKVKEWKFIKKED